jgi:hypothetical protein
MLQPKVGFGPMRFWMELHCPAALTRCSTRAQEESGLVRPAASCASLQIAVIGPGESRNGRSRIRPGPASES